MDKIRYGIIGCGMMGEEHLRNLALIDGAEVAAIFEPDAAMRARAAALVPDAQFMPSIAALLACPGLDALLIASPNYLHVPQIREIAATRALPILVEKPVFTDPADFAMLSTLDYPAPIWVAM